jgi:AraC-like DNA-binding protein
MPVDGAQSLLLERSSINSAVEDEITEYIRSTFVRHRARFVRASDAARFAVRSSRTPIVAGDRVRSTLNYSQESDPFDYFLFFVVNGGQVRMDTRDHGRIDLVAGDATLCPVGVPVGFDMHDIDLTVVRLPIARLVQVAAELTGPAGPPLRFESLRPVSAPMDRYWRALVNLVNGALMDDPSTLTNRLFAEELVRTVAIAALHTFPNTTMSRAYARGPGEVGPATLRRAVDYIDTHAAEAISVSDIAAAAGTTARALQYAFRRHFDTTPMGYLRQARLHRAHHDLQAADPTTGATVEQVAARHGFANAARFATDYQRRYGRPPTARHRGQLEEPS